jgi:hypothetical protein
VSNSKADPLRRRPHRYPAVARRTAALAAVATVAATAALAAPAGAATAGVPPEGGTWHLVRTIHRSGNPVFTAIAASSTRHGWAFAGLQAGMSRPLAYRLTSSGWHEASFPGQKGEFVSAAAATSSSDVFALTVGSKSRALRWNGSSWRAIGSFHATMDSVSANGKKNAWAFGNKGAWHWNGHQWSRSSSGHSLTAGYVRTRTDAWAVGGRSVAHWNGHTWKKTSVAGQLPPTTSLSKSRLVAIWAYSARSVWAVASGGREDEGGPTVVLHYNGHTWAQVALGNNDGTPEAVIPDPAGGLWIPAQIGDGGTFQMLRYDTGTLGAVPLPHGGNGIEAAAVSTVPGSNDSLAAGFTHKSHNLGSHIRGAIIKFRP